MSLKMFLKLRPRVEAKILHEIITYNRELFMLKHAKRARQGDYESYLRFYAAGSVEIYYLEDVDIQSKVFINQSEAYAVINGGNTTDKGQRALHYEINSKLMMYIKEAEKEIRPLSKKARSFVRKYPAYSIVYEPHDIPESIDHDKDFMEQYSFSWSGQLHIHDWFVMNVQSGNDTGGTYMVSKEELQQLLHVLEHTGFKKVSLDNQNHLGRINADTTQYPLKLSRIMPSSPRMSFSEMKYDESHEKENARTTEFIRKALEEVDFQKYMFAYQGK